MKNNKLSKLLIISMTAFLSVVQAYGSTEAEQTIQVSVQPTVAISKDAGSIETGSIKPLDGSHTGLTPKFNLQVNGDDNDYDFIMTSDLIIDGGKISAYGNNGCILFGHTLEYPTLEAIEDAKRGGSNNKNVIAYPVTVTVTNPMTAEYEAGYSTYGDCYVVKVNNETEGQVVHSIGENPIPGTYNVGQDQSGSYQVVVTLTAVSK